MLPVEPHIHFSEIVFPSDNLSFGVLRKRFPELIDAGTKVAFFALPESNPDFHSQNLTNLLEGEREVAMIAFSAVLGKSWEGDWYTNAEIKQFLADEYIHYGVASGPQHAAQLIRDIETAAADQARRHIKSR